MRLKLLRRQKSSRAKEKAGDFRENKRACFSENSQPFPCALAHRWAGKAGLPGSVSSSLHSPLRHTAWKISLIPPESGGVRGGTSSPAGFGAAPHRSLCRCGILLGNAIMHHPQQAGFGEELPPRRGPGRRPGVPLAPRRSLSARRFLCVTGRWPEWRRLPRRRCPGYFSLPGGECPRSACRPFP